MQSYRFNQSSAFAIAAGGENLFVTRLLVSGLCEAIWAVENGRRVHADRIREDDPRIETSAWCTLVRDPEPVAICGERWWLFGMLFPTLNNFRTL